jgi:plasmid stabilization system protein ParE
VQYSNNALSHLEQDAQWLLEMDAPTAWPRLAQFVRIALECLVELVRRGRDRIPKFGIGAHPNRRHSSSAIRSQTTM